MLRGSRFLCSYLEVDISRCISLGRRAGTHFTALGFIWHGESTGTWKTLNSWFCPQGAPFGDRERVCAADRAQLFQDLTDTQASVFSVSHMSLTPRPQDAASCFGWEGSIKLSQGGLYVPHSVSKPNADGKILLQGNQRLLLQ